MTLSGLATTTVKDESSSSAAAANPSVDFSDIPLTNYSGTNFPSDATKANYMVINSITNDTPNNDYLTYSATSSNPSLVTTSVSNEWLTLNYVARQDGFRHDQGRGHEPLRHDGRRKLYGNRQPVGAGGQFGL